MSNLEFVGAISVTTVQVTVNCGESDSMLWNSLGEWKTPTVVSAMVLAFDKVYSINNLIVGIKIGQPFDVDCAREVLVKPGFAISVDVINNFDPEGWTTHTWLGNHLITSGFCTPAQNFEMMMESFKNAGKDRPSTIDGLIANTADNLSQALLNCDPGFKKPGIERTEVINDLRHVLNLLLTGADRLYLSNEAVEVLLSRGDWLENWFGGFSEIDRLIEEIGDLRPPVAQYDCDYFQARMAKLIGLVGTCLASLIEL